MVFPMAFGWLQVVLAVLFLVAIALLVTAVVRARKAGWRRHIGRGAGGLVVLLVAVVLLWAVTLLQTYLGLTGEIKAAHVVARSVAGSDHTLDVELTLYGDGNHDEIHRTYRIDGDMWVLQADIVELEPWVNALGFHSGYKVTRLYGQRLDGEPVQQHQTMLNGGDGDFFTDMRDGSWFTTPFIRSAYGNAVIATPGTYDVYISDDAIKTRQS
ncbi:hypothetical protein [Nocardia vermiculata]|uniref:Uncharacterized protein n=1 Tax=Nocardia vermiculata TaxID=257274 RepID=A0A846Y414_9NOCA|nr:hypothetical protein [Nocardia vermiculata]NKY52594.1 hypothetical protein [Nocardia vermiculata]